MWQGRFRQAQRQRKQQAKMLISPEDLLTVSSNALASGPSITGSIEPERRADLRAEVSAVVLAVLKENGDPVKRGDLLVRLDQTSIRDSLTAAEASARAADQAYEQAERQFQRMVTLRETDVVSTQQLEDVEIRRNTAQSEREAAGRAWSPRASSSSAPKCARRSTASSATARCRRATPRRWARNCSRSSIRPACASKGWCRRTASAKCEPGSTSWFRIHGFADRDFTGIVTRVNPAANVTTRQVEVLVASTTRRSSRTSPACTPKGASRLAAARR